MRAREKQDEDVVKAAKAKAEREANDKMRKERLEIAVDLRKERRGKIIAERKHREQYYNRVTKEREEALALSLIHI